MTSPLRHARILATFLVVTAALVACSSKPAICTDVENLQRSVEHLRNVQLQAGALGTIHNDVNQIQQQLETLKRDAKSQYSPEIAQFSSALNNLSANVNGAKASPTASNIAAVRSAVGAVVDSAKRLASSVSDTC